MESLNYPSLFAEFEEGARTAANLHATLKHYSDKEKPQGVELWAQGMSRYMYLMYYLCLCLIGNAEWAAEVDRILKPVGCPAQRIPLIEKFFNEKGVVLNEGVALFIP